MKKHRANLKYFILCLVAFAGALAHSKEEKPNPVKAENLPTRELMDQFVQQLTHLKLYMVSEQKFTDPKNSEVIGSHLTDFARLAKKLKHDPQLSQENFRFSRDVLEEHIINTERTFRLGNKLYARWQLGSTVQACMSCHTQIPMANKSFGEFKGLKIFSSDFDRAEFLFSIRDFEQAHLIYDGLILNFPKNLVEAGQLERSLERQVAYYSRVKRDPEGAVEKLNLYLGNAKLPEYIKKNISAWTSQFKVWKTQRISDPKGDVSEKEILAFAKKNLLGEWSADMKDALSPTLVNDLRVSGFLYEYLQAHPHSAIEADILYWLAVCERRINNNFFFSLADLYLKECMNRFPNKTVARKCLDEYESETILGYTGSAGINLPPDVQAELARLKKWVESGGRMKLRSN